MTKDIDKRQTDIAKHSTGKDIEILVPVKKTNPFISFRYSYKSVSSIGGKTHIKSKEKSFENGKFQSEEFEGTLDGNVYSSMVGEMQKRILGQLAVFLKPFGLIGKDKNSK
jgi:hypothetical protein